MTATVTISHAADWTAKRILRVRRCESCGGMRMDFDAPHAPRWVGERLLDCSGREVSMRNPRGEAKWRTRLH